MQIRPIVILHGPAATAYRALLGQLNQLATRAENIAASQAALAKTLEMLAQSPAAPGK
jgi:hypothetical protein